MNDLLLLRAELRVLGPVRVRNAMVAFDHDKQCTDGSHCCFLMHAMDSVPDQRQTSPCYDALPMSTRQRIETLLATRMLILGTEDAPVVERAFENLSGCDRGTLREECITFLAESGTAVESTSERSVVCA